MVRSKTPSEKSAAPANSSNNSNKEASSSPSITFSQMAHLCLTQLLEEDLLDESKLKDALSPAQIDELGGFMTDLQRRLKEKDGMELAERLFLMALKRAKEKEEGGETANTTSAAQATPSATKETEEKKREQPTQQQQQQQQHQKENSVSIVPICAGVVKLPKSGELPPHLKAQVKAQIETQVKAQVKAQLEAAAVAANGSKAAVKSTASKVKPTKPSPSVKSGPSIKPRSFLEAALYFSSLTPHTLSLANSLTPAAFFAPALLKSSSRWEETEPLQRAVSALFAIGLAQTPASSRTVFAIGSGSGSGTNNQENPHQQVTRGNFLKRAVGVFAVSLVDNLPASLSSSILPGSKSLSAEQSRLALDDLAVPTSAQLASYWELLQPEQRAQMLDEEMDVLSRGWHAQRRTWCLCKYCKHRHLRLHDVFDLFYRCYFEELEMSKQRELPPSAASAATVVSEVPGKGKAKGKNENGRPTASEVNQFKMTAHQLKVRRTLYEGLSLIAQEAIENPSEKMMESMSKLTDYFYAEDDQDLYEHCDQHAGGNQDEDWDDFYQDFNQAEDGEYLHVEGDLAIELCALPSQRILTARPKPNTSQGEQLFNALVNQIFQFHLVPAYLEHQAQLRQSQLIAEEQQREEEARAKEAAKLLAKQRKRERQRQAKLKSRENDSATVETITPEQETIVKPEDVTIAKTAGEAIAAKTELETIVKPAEDLAEETVESACDDEMADNNLTADNSVNGSVKEECASGEIHVDHLVEDVPPGLANQEEEDSPPGLLDPEEASFKSPPGLLDSPAFDEAPRHDSPPGLPDTPVVDYAAPQQSRFESIFAKVLSRPSDPLPWSSNTSPPSLHPQPPYAFDPFLGQPNYYLAPPPPPHLYPPPMYPQQYAMPPPLYGVVPPPPPPPPFLPMPHYYGYPAAMHPAHQHRQPEGSEFPWNS